jgi:hypothetical protein
MRFPEGAIRAGLRIVLSLFIYSTGLAQVPESVSKPSNQSSDASYVWNSRARFVKAYVVDDRLSALRREASLQSQVVQRLRAARRVFILAAKNGRRDQPKFYRVAVTRRTRGWIHQAALAVPGRAGEDERVVRLIKSAEGGMYRLSLCRLFIEAFNRSPLLPRVLLAMAEEAERAADSLTRRARTRLKQIDGRDSEASPRDYYLSDVGLDRYSRLWIKFDLNAATAEYVYDGAAYREIIRRFPKSEEAKLARKQLDVAAQKLARRQQ